MMKILKKQKMLVLTFGAQGVLVFAAHQAAQFFPIRPLPVPGTTIGCGDAFIAYFLAEFWQSQDVALAVQQGTVGGAKALAWLRPLPAEAYQIH